MLHCDIKESLIESSRNVSLVATGRVCGSDLPVSVHTVGSCWFVQALGAAEDETDIQAAKVARDEQKAELAEFDENIPWDEREVTAKREREEQSKVEMELALLEKEVLCHLLNTLVQ